MSTDPQVQAILAMYAGLPAPDYATLRAVDYRAGVAQMQPVPLNEDVARVTECVLPGPAGPLSARLYHPQPGALMPGIVFFHGGGWVACSVDSHDNICRRLARLAGCAVLSVDYRLAPEAVFPAALDDGCAALRWVAAHGAAFGIDASRLAVAGDSAGGNLAAACAQLARDPALELPPLRHQLLFYPVLDSGCGTPSYAAYAQGYLLTADMMRWFWRQYAPSAAARSDVRAAPGLASSVAGLPAATVLLAQCDPLHDEGWKYAERLRAAGVPVTLRSWEGLFHGFASMVGMLPAADEAVAVGAAEVRKALLG
ncbi:alpha/beta hydrolase fold domain-containing protein [Duganella sp. FT92W]|uniref:Alpha/beta hydrolase fold domain-containing protein n=1 Tax=Pseudoduganella rivuli TaxID=2666085 RepID=A0A7X2LSA9_9BURK|nr:alpha/beta hydrolase [Pseudoduganella rivuli]MRV72091.1 alpha/beta hydrolase fold domain-containing protein [Pseudoduganella rivuli]